MYLVIAEKPSVSRAIAEVIGAQERKDGYLQRSRLYGQLVFWTSCRICFTGCLR